MSRSARRYCRWSGRTKRRIEERDRVPVLAAYDLCLKCSHLFNLLDARGAISVTERVGIIGRIRNLTVGVARAYAATLATHTAGQAA